MKKSLSVFLAFILAFSFMPAFYTFADDVSFSDNFSSGLSSWTPYNKSVFYIDNGAATSETETTDRLILNFGENKWSDFALEYDVLIHNIEQNGQIGFNILVQQSGGVADFKKSYTAAIKPTEAVIVKTTGSSGGDKVARKEMNCIHGKTYKCKIEVKGSTINFYVDSDTPTLTYTENDLKNGYIAMSVYKGKAGFDNIKLTGTLTEAANSGGTPAATAAPKPAATKAPAKDTGTSVNVSNMLPSGLLPPNQVGDTTTVPLSGAGNQASKRQGQGPAPVYPGDIKGLVSFPGAEGFGSRSVGGRGGKIIAVTNLNDSGPGSFRSALGETGPRIIIFKVSGTIFLKSPIRVVSPYCTIAAQTSPGGIAIGGDSFLINTHDIIIRGLRSRVGDLDNDPSKPGIQPIGDDRNSVNIATLPGSPGFEYAPFNVMIDHCSFTWGVDEVTTTYYGANNITIQYSIMSECLYQSLHSEGKHSKGMLIGADTNALTVHHNLQSSNDERNFRTLDNSYSELINNITYNWGFRGLHFSATDHNEGKVYPGYLNLIGNIFKPGPSSRSEINQGINLDDKKQAQPDSAKVFMYGNVTTGAYTSDTPQKSGAAGKTSLLTSELAMPISSNVRIQTPEEAYYTVLENVGAITPKRDAVDERLVRDVINGTGRLIDSQTEVGGWPEFENIPYPTDSDNDGIPDEWENTNGLDPKSAFDASQYAPSGYTWIEEYINSLIPMPNLNPGKLVYNKYADGVGSIGNSDESLLPAGKAQYSYIKFDLSDLKGAPINAQLRLSYKRPPKDDRISWDSQKVDVYLSDNATSLTGMTVANAPAVHSIIASQNISFKKNMDWGDGDGYGTYSFDITDAVNEKLNTDKVITLCIKTDGNTVEFLSSKTDSYKPHLEYTINGTKELISDFKKDSSSETPVSEDNSTKYAFSDIAGIDWAIEPITRLAEKGIIAGIGEGKFDPDGKVTRSQFVKLLMAAFNLENPNAVSSFNDVKEGEWYYPYVACAEAYGFFDGIYSGSFGPDVNMSREDMAALAYRVSASSGLILPKKTAADDFSDSSSIVSYAAEGIKAMQQAGIINGVGNGMFEPKADVSRAQSAKIIYLLFILR